jgi:hypothetical protein
MGHAHRSGDVTNVAKVEVGRVFYQKTIESMASKRWRGFMVMELGYEGNN